MTFWKRHNDGDSKKISGCQECKGGMNRQSTEDFYGSENILYDVIMMDTCHTLDHTHGMYTTRTEP